jgi:predicted transposase YbfD/YdcC
MPYTAKKTTQLVVERGNDYVIAVKGNQPKLFHQLQATCRENQFFERFTDIEKNRNRVTYRIVSVFDDIRKIDSDWSGVKSLVQVDRIGIRQGQAYQQTNYYISSLAASAAQFAQFIRGHWGIENRFHWVKDVVFQEDTLPLRHHNAASNWSLLRTIVINLARQHGYDSLTKAERFLSHNIDKLFSLLE